MESNNPSEDFAAPTPEELLKHFPLPIRESYARYASSKDPAAADEVVLAIVRDHVPTRRRGAATGAGDLENSASLTEDLGIDSVSIADAVFMLEDVFGVNIATKELVRLRTVGDLRAFIRTKLALMSDA